jgi:hypothetical protein
MPECTTGPFVIGAPVSRLPVCAGWIPCPVEFLLNSPWMTLILCFSGSSGESVRDSVIAAPDPAALQ